ncbi:hypothetical protein [Helicobacter saguini]|nr:hypothetical protein [Helicobacter saguini]
MVYKLESCKLDSIKLFKDIESKIDFIKQMGITLCNTKSAL